MRTSNHISFGGRWVIRIFAVGYLLIACCALFLVWLLREGWGEFHPGALFVSMLFGGAGVMAFVGIRRKWRDFHFVILFVAPIPLMWLVHPVAEAWQFHGCQEYLRSWENQLSEEYDLRFHQLSIDPPQVISVDYALSGDTRGHPILTDDVIGFVTGGRTSLDFAITNRSGEQLWIDWPEAQYVDEFRKTHPVIVSREGQPNPFAEHETRPTILRPWEHLRYISVVPRYKLKTDVCTEQGVRWGKQERLVPSDLARLTREEATARIRHLAETDTPVHLMVPVSIGSDTFNYRFEFTMEPVWWYGERSEEDIADTDRVLAKIGEVYSTANHSGPR